MMPVPLVIHVQVQNSNVWLKFEFVAINFRHSIEWYLTE